MKYVVWGASTWGIRFYDCLKIYDCETLAFIDSDKEKQGQKCENLPIISIEEYIEKYSYCMIVIAMSSKRSVAAVKKILHDHGIFLYLNMHDCVFDLFYQYHDRRFPFKEALTKVDSLIYDKKIGISGITFFGMLLYDFLKEKQYKVFLVNSKGYAINNDYDYLKEYNLTYNIISEEESEKYCDVILQVDPSCGTNKNMKEFNENKIPFFEFPYLSDYQNPHLKQFKNIHISEKRCFIVCTGPSLKLTDLNLLHERKEITFSMNRVYKAFSETNWRPTYYFAGDIEMFLLYEDDILNMEVKYKFLSDWHLPFWEKNSRKKDLYRYHLMADYEREGEDDFSDDFSKGVYNGMTVAYNALQAVIYMGFKKIYIIGADFNYSGNGASDHNHFIAGYSDKKRATKTYVFDYEQIYKSYQAAKKYAEGHGIKIYNATRGGKLEVFERVDFDSLF